MTKAASRNCTWKRLRRGRRTCKVCGCTFYATRWDAGICSAACRKRHSRLVQKAMGRGII